MVLKLIVTQEQNINYRIQQQKNDLPYTKKNSLFETQGHLDNKNKKEQMSKDT